MATRNSEAIEQLLRTEPHNYDYALLKYVQSSAKINTLDNNSFKIVLKCCRTFTKRKKKLIGNLMPQVLRICSYDNTQKRYINKFVSYQTVRSLSTFDFNDPRYFVYDLPTYVGRSNLVTSTYEMEKRLHDILKVIPYAHQRRMFTAYYYFFGGNVETPQKQDPQRSSESTRDAVNSSILDDMEVDPMERWT